MSHFVKIRTIIRETELLQQALRDLGFSFREGEGLVVRGDARKTETAEIVVATGSSWDIGFRRTGEGYEIVADWYRIEQRTPLRRKEFHEKVARRYAYHVVLAQAREQDLVVEEETVEDGNIVLVLSEKG